MRFLLFLLLLCSSSIALSQKSFEMKFSDISKEDMNMKVCSFDSSAKAVMLGEVTSLWMDLNPKRRYVYRLEVHRRIKILSVEGKNVASIKIPYYRSSSSANTDIINNFKAVTYNLENDEIVKTKLRKEDKFDNNLSEYRGELSFTMPNVKVGSIIEYRYTISSIFIGSLRTKYLQSFMPIRDFKYDYTLPDFLYYRVSMLGNFLDYEINSKTDGIRFGKRYETGKNTSIVGHNVLAYDNEPYMTSFKSVVPRVEYSLVKFQSAYTFNEDYGTTYEKLNKSLLEANNFGIQLKKGKFVKRWSEEMKGMNKLEKAKFVLSKMQTSVAWDGSFTTYSSTSGKSLLKDGKGRLGEINIAFIAALRYLDIEVYPVISYTRKQGIPHPVYPSRFNFNYITALVIIEDKEFLCDASLDMPFGMIRPEAINYNGWLVSENGRWIDLTRNSEVKSSSIILVKLEKDKLVSTVKQLYKGYAAFERYHEFNNNRNEFEIKLKSNYPEWNIKSIEYGKDNSKSLFAMDLLLEKELIDSELIIINPMFTNGFSENPFVREDRISNVDFNFKRNNYSYFELAIPRGYEIEIPKSSRSKTIDDSITSSYLVSQKPEKLSIVNKTKFNKNSFSPMEYDGLKSIIDGMVQNNSQSIILKKSK